MSKLKKFFSKKNWKILAILVGIIVLLGVFISWNRQKNQGSQFVEHRVERQDITQSLVLSGFLDAKERVYLNFVAGGKLVYLGAKEGEWVKKWQTIATIDARDLQKNLEKNLNLYENYRFNWDAQVKEDKDQVLEEDEIRARKQDQNLLENTVLDVELISVATSNRVMTAPFAGILLTMPSQVTGIVLSPTDVFELVNPKTLLVSAELDEIDLSLVSLGQRANLVFDAYPDESIESEIGFIALKSTAGSTGTVFKIELAMPEVDDLIKYRLGMNADVEIELAKRTNVLVIPLEAITSKQGETMVRVKSQNRQGYEDRVVELGLESDDAAEIINGLEEGEIVLIEN
jgi:RND family efflux transporter MFP subunit